MKKFLPFFLLFLGVTILAGFFFLIGRKQPESKVEPKLTQIQEIPLEKRPFTSLTPSSDGHWLTLRIEDLDKIGTNSIDYELLYSLPDGRTQGVPGTIKIDKNSIERKLLLGSESSGKFKFDEGVEKGTLTLKFRDEKGKLVGKLSTDFHLQSNEKELTSIDDKFKFVLDKVPKGVFFVTMETFGISENTSAVVTEGPYAIFSSSQSQVTGTVQ